MPHEARTARELEALIRIRMPMGVALEIVEDQRLGWTAKVIARPGVATDLQFEADEIACHLRSKFDLLKQ